MKVHGPCTSSQMVFKPMPSLIQQVLAVDNLPAAWEKICNNRAWLPRENILSARHPEKLIAWLKPS